MSGFSYSSLRWRRVAAQARKRDGDACSVSRLFGGACSGGTPHVHHLVPLAESGAPYDLDNTLTVCRRHHPMLEALRRRLLAEPVPPRCHHRHQSVEAREICERRLARRTSVAA